MKFRTQFDEAAHIAAAQKTWIDCSRDPGVTSQSAALDLDINRIVKRAGINDAMSVEQVEALIGRGEYGQFSSELTFHQAMNTMKDAERTFMALPASVRSQFGNSPAEMLDALRSAAAGDEKALARVRKAGLVAAEQVPSGGELSIPPVSSAPAAVPAPAAAAPAPDQGATKPGGST